MTAIEAFLSARDFLVKHREDYDTAYKVFEWPTFESFNWALDYFDSMARGNNTPALWVVDENGSEIKKSFAEMSARSNQVANHLRDLGVKRGDRILIMLPNIVPLWEVMLAAIKLGAVISPASTLLTPEDLIDRIERGDMKHVIAGAAETSRFNTVPGSYTRIVVGDNVEGWNNFAKSEQTSSDFAPDAPTNPNELLLLYFTSGTTAKPKLVAHSHQSYPIGHLSTMYWIGLQPGDIHWNISSPGWAKHAWSNFFAPWNAGATVFVYNYSRFNAKSVLDALVKYNVTTLCAPPTVWRMMIQEDLAAYPVKIRELIGAGEPLNPEVIDCVHKAWNIRIRDGFGQTETTAQIGNSPGQPIKLGSMGRPLPGYKIRLLDPDEKPAKEGQICLALDPRPTGLMIGYLGDEGKTAEYMRDGHYHTGDVAVQDDDGYITYVGRADDVFKASDYRISPFELESALIEHPAVAEAAVVPSPDPVRLAVPKAYLTLSAGHIPNRELALSIFRHVRDHLSPFKRIRRIEFGDLPKTISGKIRRVELRHQETGRRKEGVRGETEFWEEDFPELKG
ncbi:4-hydroxybutyrate--CoA ligase 1 [Azospirillaceae bacterium]